MRVSTPPEHPTLLFDATCGFCRKWVARLAESAPEVDTRPYQESLSDFPEIDEEACRKSVQWIETGGEVRSGAAAGLEFWAASSRLGRFVRTACRSLPGARTASEFGYRAIASSRSLTSRLALEMWGSEMIRPRFRISGDLFLRCLGLIYLTAFLSLLLQIQGLVGSSGILPITDTLQIVSDRFGAASTLKFPTLLWLWPSDTALTTLCLLGMTAGAIGVFAPGVWATWIVSFLAYLSLVTVGRDFMSFQWDALLLETGALAIVQTVLHARCWASGSERRARTFSASPTPIRSLSFLYRWLLFRLMFSSGVVKLTSNDETWLNLTALTPHYETQPLPNVIAWYAHHLPSGFHTASCLAVFGIELAVPFLFFAPKRLRHSAAAVVVGFQLLIFLTGNYAFFNLLALTLCFWLVEDTAWPRTLAKRFNRPLGLAGPNILGRLVAPAICLNLAISSMVMTRGVFRQNIRFPGISQIYSAIAPYRLLNNYGLFAVMTQDRPEIILEGSLDGTNWENYEFYYKPGDVYRPPPFVAPHQPRLDWQMWFVAQGPIKNSSWFYPFAQRLFDGSDSVRDLLAVDPFPDTPPRYLRARVFNYQFASPEERKTDGVWWKRTFSHVFLPPVVRRRP